MIEFIGVRSSWLMLARNWLFIRSASRMRRFAVLELLREARQLLHLAALFGFQLADAQALFLQVGDADEEKDDAPKRNSMRVMARSITSFMNVRLPHQHQRADVGEDIRRD